MRAGGLGGDTEPAKVSRTMYLSRANPPLTKCRGSTATWRRSWGHERLGRDTPGAAPTTRTRHAPGGWLYGSYQAGQSATLSGASGSASHAARLRPRQEPASYLGPPGTRPLPPLAQFTGGKVMADNKLEPRLLKFIDEQKVRASAREITAAEVEEQETIRVTVSHEEHVRADEVRPEEGLARAAALEGLERQVQPLQEPILARLAVAGAGPVKQHALTNAITADLTPDQIRQVTELDEVKLVRLETLDQVTTMNESVEVIEAREVWDQLNFNGRGIRVAILDT